MEIIKEEITRYWAERSGQFSTLRLAELNSEKREQWMEEILRYLPSDKSLRILDVGTGSGFFSIILASLGHQVTGIDLTEEMIKEAEKTADALELSIDFQVMDAENPDFAEDTFDVILSRNLTWTLPHLENAYLRWKRILKPGGILLNFDADYCRETPIEKQTLPEVHSHESIGPGLTRAYEQLKSELAPGQHPRPAWDISLLEKAGYHDILVDRTLSDRLYKKFDEFYNPTPMFAIRAVKEIK